MIENAPAKSKADILVVDDTPDNLRLLNLILSSQYKVRLIPSGEQALLAARSTPPDLILLDIIMPKMDGFQVAAQLKADRRTSQIPIIFISALDDVDSIVRSFTAGGVDYITKPFHNKEVLARVQTHLALRNLQRQLQAANAELARQNERLREQITRVEALQAQLVEQTIRDPLTGAFNRRYLFETLARELGRAEREGCPLSLVMMDVDRFKEFNDAYGHQAGDLLLQQLVELVSMQTRIGDAVCRYGGEEFVVLMPQASLQDAQQRAEEWRMACERMKIDYQGESLGVTLSLGVVTNLEPGMDAEKLLNMADQAMYLAKAGGRNRTATLEQL